MEEKNIILNSTEIANKIRRIAFQIYETNVKESEIVIAGIADKGFVLAERIATILKEISNMDIILCKVTMDKQNPLGTVKANISKEAYSNKALVLTDDVLNTGSSLAYGVSYFLEVPLKKFKTAVLVNRNHKRFPIKADFKGISLSTSLQNHVTVHLDEDTNKDEVFLM